LTDAGNQIGSFTAENSVTGNIELVNSGILNLLTLSNTVGDIKIDNTGKVETIGKIMASGAVQIEAHSPLIIGSDGIEAGGNISLTAGATAGSGDDLTLNGAVVSTGSGNIVLSAGDNLAQNASISSAGGSVSMTAETGNIAIAPSATTNTTGTIRLAARAGSITGTPPANAIISQLSTVVEPPVIEKIAQELSKDIENSSKVVVGAQPLVVAPINLMTEKDAVITLNEVEITPVEAPQLATEAVVTMQAEPVTTETVVADTTPATGESEVKTEETKTEEAKADEAAPASDAPTASEEKPSAVVVEKASSKEGLTYDAEMSRTEMGQMLELRHKFKTELFKDALATLEKNSAAANIKECHGGASSGCMLTGKSSRKVKRQLPKPKVAHIPQIERKIALLIGNNEYTGTVPKLVGAIPDVNAIGELFKTRLGYEVRIIRDAKKADIIESMNKLVEELNENDSVTIYYAGHGYQMGNTREGYWIPVDGSATSPDNWLSNNDINKYLSNIAAKQVMLISDSCYSGTLASEAKVRVNGELQPTDVLKNRSVVVMSSGGDEPVADLGKGGHSIFAWSLMQAMKQVTNWKDGSSLYQQIHKEVTETFPQTPQYGASPAAGHILGGDFLFEERRY